MNGRTLTGLLNRLERFHLPLLLILSVLIRIRVFFHLDEIVISWRPTDNASIALNFFRHGYHILYPQILWGGSGPGYVEMEFPIVQYATAQLYGIFGVSNLANLVLPFLSGLGIVTLAYLLARHVFNPVAGFFAALFAAISPTLSTFCQMLQVDPEMIFLSALGLYAFLRWMEYERFRYYIVAVLSVSLAALIKPTALHIGLPLLFLCYQKYRMAFFRRPLLWLFAVVSLLPSVVWYWHAHELFLEYQNTFGILDRGGLKFATIGHLTSLDFYAQTGFRILALHVTPFVSVFLFLGLLKRQEHATGFVFHVWFAAVLIYILIVARGVDAGHQYLLPVIMPASVLAGLGFSSFLTWLESKRWWSLLPRRTAVVVGLIAVFAVSTVDMTEIYHEHDYWGPTSPYPLAEKESGIAIGKVTRPGSLIIVTSSLMDDRSPDESMTPPDIFYFSDRRGWYSAFAWLDMKRIEQLREKGACYLVSSSNYATQFKTEDSDLFRQLSVRYHTIMDNNKGLVIDLCHPRLTKVNS